MSMSGSLGGRGYDTSSQSDESYNFERLHVEPIYDSFLCPLTKQVMRDPVTLENGQTFEREAIENWFKECKESGKALICPLTQQELSSTNLNPSLALRNTIEQWSTRNEAAQLDMSLRALSTGNSEADILQALKYVQYIAQKSRVNKRDVRYMELIPMIVDMLKNTSRRVRCRALQTLRIVIEEDDNNMEIMAVGDTVRTIVKLLSHERSKEREEAIYLLYELSKSEILCEKIGLVNGAILILIGMTSSKSEYIPIVEKAEKTLDNLEKCENNVRQMAEYGRLQPLLTLLLQGSSESKVAMAAFLGELVLSNDVKVYVARTVGYSLISLMKSNTMESRESSLKALNQISSDEASSKVLIESGILPPLIKDLFAVGPKHLPMRLKEITATILANVVNSGYDFDSLKVGSDQKTLVSEDIVHNLLHLISNTGPTIGCKLLQVLVGLTNTTTTALSVVSAIKSSGATISLVQLIEAPQKDLRLASIKLIQNLSGYMGQELADALRGVTGQISSLINLISENIEITEEQSAAVTLLASLPEWDTSLTREMLNEHAFELIISRVVKIQQGEIRGSRFITPYLEGLVKVLARLPFALTDEPNAIALCREHNLASVFIELLQKNGLDNVQMISAMALENFSRESIKLTKIPSPSSSCCGLRKRSVSNSLCRVHRGICSLKESFCLLEGKAVVKLVAHLDHQNEKVVEASIGALSTLLDDDVEINQGVQILHEADAITPILDVLIKKRTEKLTRRAVWVVERLLRNEDIACEVTGDRNVNTALFDAFRHGDYRTRQIAELALKHVDKLPNFSGFFPKSG